MKITCDIIDDLLPLYKDEVCSEDSRKLVDGHIATCDRCRRELEKYDDNFKGVEKMEENIEEARPLKEISNRFKRDRKSSFLKGVALVSIMGSILSIIAYNANGSYIDENGYLIESFGFIPLAYLFALIAFISLVSLMFGRLLKK